MADSTSRGSNASPVRPITSQTTTATAPTTPGPSLPPTSRGAGRQTEIHKTQSDTTSDRATTAFIRRTLCSQNVLLGNGEKGGNTPRPIGEDLPPLTSSNEVDLQLYAIISIIIKEFVQTWYSKITPDHVFVNEVIQIIAHCTRALEQRIRKVDLESLLLDEIPELIEAHLSAFRLAKQQATHHQSLVSDPRNVYHMLYPHPALSPVPCDSVPSTIVEQRENESAWRQLLVQGVLVMLLPTEDLENACLRALVAEIFAEMILGNGISGKACEGWLLWEGITRVAEVLQTDSIKEKGLQSGDTSPDQSLTRLERFGLLGPPMDAYSEPMESSLASRPGLRSVPMTLSGVFWALVQYAFLACTAMRAAIVAVATSSSLPPRCVPAANGQSPVEPSDQLHLSATAPSASRRPPASKRPIVSMKLWSCASNLVELDRRMPWLSGAMSMLQWGALRGPGRVGYTDGALDRFLSHTMRMRVLDPAFIPILLRTVRTGLFPNNNLVPPRQSPSDEEVRKIKRRCATALLDLLPASMAAAFFATENPLEKLRRVEQLLDCLDDAYLNKHLVFQIVELIVLRLVPELGERGVQELMDERLG
ncbi:PXA domain-containing protein [Massariosphaeria phaeospora]|uniref:PXA domain-containing protein n=1 Tax=Massariosphaeria phaeospora TaxID=100035 RepID=A0A7C8MRU1_9PLEO|nr:PXA domain-containing protein [Massariosphaeria phaeospora]